MKKQVIKKQKEFEDKEDKETINYTYIYYESFEQQYERSMFGWEKDKDI
jgi:hypothetical protein